MSRNNSNKPASSTSDDTPVVVALDKPMTGNAPAAASYTAEELAAVAQELFKTNPECVLAALRLAGKTNATRAEAADIVQKYMSKEVK